MKLECESCAWIGEPKDFQPRQRGQPDVCTDCHNELAAPGASEKISRQRLLTRAAWRARARGRAARPQMDLVDLITPKV